LGAHIVSIKNGSAEIYELDGARARLRGSDLDPNNFLAVGPFLEAVRVQQNLSVETVSERTHIKASYIDAIERMDANALPSKPFAIGFVRGYAEFLGLDPTPVVERFKDEAGYSGVRRDPAPTEAAAPPVVAPHEPQRLSLLAVLAILGFMVWCAYLVTHPGPGAIKRPLKLNGVPLAEGPVGSRSVTDAPESRQAAEPEFRPAEVPPPPAIVEAAILDRVDPVYPPRCEQAAQATETVNVAFTITPNGDVVSERVQSSTNPCFDRAALNAIKRWRFSPKTIDGAARPAFEQQASFRFERPS
jgi:TonB family protein